MGIFSSFIGAIMMNTTEQPFQKADEYNQQPFENLAKLNWFLLATTNISIQWMSEKLSNI